MPMFYDQGFDFHESVNHILLSTPLAMQFSHMWAFCIKPSTPAFELAAISA